MEKESILVLVLTVDNSSKVLPYIFPPSIMASHLTLIEQDIQIGLTR
jgi:hypothetical protein